MSPSGAVIGFLEASLSIKYLGGPFHNFGRKKLGVDIMDHQEYNLWIILSSLWIYLDKKPALEKLDIRTLHVIEHHFTDKQNHNVCPII